MDNNEFKYSLIEKINVASNLKDTENRIQLLTSQGILTGDPVLPEKITDNEIVEMICNRTLMELGEEERRDLSFLLLRDAKLIMGNGSTVNFHRLVVFLDEIIGVTYGVADIEIR